MSNKPAELISMLSQDDSSAWVSHLWHTFNTQRKGWLDEVSEARDFVFATDTTTTTANTLPWSNTTTLPKLCQIRDNLHANYLSGLFPNDDWLQWKGYSLEDSVQKKAQAIEGYMKNKTRESHFREEMSKLLYDFIDYGNAFATVDFEATYHQREDGQTIPSYVGPVARRISPLDVVFNPMAKTFKDSWKIVRSIKTVGELQVLADSQPDNSFWREALERRQEILSYAGSQGIEDFEKYGAYSVDGFGNLYEYYQSNYVEILEFYGDYHDQETDTLESNRILTIVDRSFTVRNVEQPSWLGHAPIYHVGWRLRPDNLWAMSPLANLVGIQYRIDHLQNAKADAVDLVIQPPLKIKGEVEQFEWGPSSEIHLDENGDVDEVARNLQGVIAAQSEVQELMMYMEEFAGAPREAMGMRTPGEKTAFEVQQLQNAAGRIFQEKITSFEIGLLEPTLNAMLEVGRRNLDASDIIRVMDTEINSEVFLTVTKADLAATGKIRPIGARHFAEQARLVQELSTLFSSPLGQMVQPHTSMVNLTKVIESALNLEHFKIFSKEAGVVENAETVRTQNAMTEEIINEEQI